MDEDNLEGTSGINQYHGIKDVPMCGIWDDESEDEDDDEDDGNFKRKSYRNRTFRNYTAMNKSFDTPSKTGNESIRSPIIFSHSDDSAEKQTKNRAPVFSRIQRPSTENPKSEPVQVKRRLFGTGKQIDNQDSNFKTYKTDDDVTPSKSNITNKIVSEKNQDTPVLERKTDSPSKPIEVNFASEKFLKQLQFQKRPIDAFNLFYQQATTDLASMTKLTTVKSQLRYIIMETLSDASFELNGTMIKKIFKLIKDFGFDDSVNWNQLIDQYYTRILSSKVADPVLFERLNLFSNLALEWLSINGIRLKCSSALKLFRMAELPPLFSNKSHQWPEFDDISTPLQTSLDVSKSDASKNDVSISDTTKSSPHFAKLEISPLTSSSISSPCKNFTPDKKYSTPKCDVKSESHLFVSPASIRALDKKPFTPVSPPQSPTPPLGTTPSTPSYHLITHNIKHENRAYKRPEGYVGLDFFPQGPPKTIPCSPLIDPLDDPRLMYKINEPKPKKVVKTSKKSPGDQNKATSKIKLKTSAQKKVTKTSIMKKSRFNQSTSDKSSLNTKKPYTKGLINASLMKRRPTNANRKRVAPKAAQLQQVFPTNKMSSEKVQNSENMLAIDDELMKIKLDSTEFLKSSNLKNLTRTIIIKKNQEPKSSDNAVIKNSGANKTGEHSVPDKKKVLIVVKSSQNKAN